MLSTKIRTTVVTLIAAVSLGGAAIVPASALASKTQKELKDKGLSCEHTSDNLTTCTDKEGHEWYCEESTDTCEQVKLEVVKPRTVLAPSTGMLKAPETGSPPPTRVSLVPTVGARL